MKRRATDRGHEADRQLSGEAPCRTMPNGAARPRWRGFTLIEILIALAVFAIVSASLLTSASRSITATTRLRDKTVAEWIAVNEINRLRNNVRNDDSYPSAGRSQAEVRMADMDWLVETEVSDTDNRDVRRVTVDVARRVDRSEEQPVLSFTGFVGRY